MDPLGTFLPAAPSTLSHYWFNTTYCMMVRGYMSFFLVVLGRDPVSVRVKLGDGSHTVILTAKL